MAQIISPCLNSTIDDIKLESLRILGAAAQSNPKVQKKALEHDYIQKLLHIIATSSNLQVKSRSIFALSALVRHFPAAQKILLDHGALAIFSKILDSDQSKIQIRVLNLMNDMIQERTSFDLIDNEKEKQLKLQAYEATELEAKLSGHDFCNRVVDLIERSEDKELLDVIHGAISNFQKVCQFKSMEGLDKLRRRDEL